MKKISLVLFIAIVAVLLFTAESCDNSDRREQAQKNTSALTEQQYTENNQQGLFSVQPPPKLTWSLERDNLIKRFLLMNDRSVMFYMYIFIPGVADPIGYYQINKVSSVNSQLTNTEQLVYMPSAGSGTQDFYDMPSPAEDGSYGTNGDGVFGFTPEDVYIEHNMLYVTSTVPLTFRNAVQRLLVIDVKTKQDLDKLMKRVNSAKEKGIAN